MTQDKAATSQEQKIPLYKPTGGLHTQTIGLFSDSDEIITLPLLAQFTLFPTRQALNALAISEAAAVYPSRTGEEHMPKPGRQKRLHEMPARTGHFMRHLPRSVTGFERNRRPAKLQRYATVFDATLG